MARFWWRFVGMGGGVGGGSVGFVERRGGNGIVRYSY